MSEKKFLKNILDPQKDANETRRASMCDLVVSMRYTRLR